MPLRDLPLRPFEDAIPGDVVAFLKEAARRIEEFQIHCRVPGFVPCDHERAYRYLRALSESDSTRGNLFCEWGSGFGVVTCLAAFLDFDPVGIEIEGELVAEAQRLADDFAIPATFVEGSYLPPGSGIVEPDSRDYSWLRLEEERLEFDPEDFDVIFAYPWPDEEDLAAILFERFGSNAGVLLSYHGGDKFRVRRKAGKK